MCSFKLYEVLILQMGKIGQDICSVNCLKDMPGKLGNSGRLEALHAKPNE